MLAGNCGPVILAGAQAGAAAEPPQRRHRREVSLEFFHGGTAAATTAGSVNSATITAGTGLGSGFRPWQALPSLNLAPDLWTGLA